MTRRPRVHIVAAAAAIGEVVRAVPVAVVPAEPFGLAGTTVVAHVTDPATASAVLRAIVRGADAVLHVEVPDAPAFLDALGRVADVRLAGAPSLDEDQRSLLGLLARGMTAAQAARQTGMSLRTAHRRLAAARATLDATCNAEAITRLGPASAEG